ncbi:MAG TPA: hypothetical protein VGO09_04630 [Flavisolibacter sp.]|nr:hypothetical protein [Flavisolibacter sp.]
MKRDILNFALVIFILMAGSGCEQHYYRVHHEHSNRYNHHHHDNMRY